MTDMAVPFATAEVAFEKFKELVIHPLSDLHVGAHRHNERKLKEKLAAIRRAGDNHRVLLMGDLADINTVSSKHFDPTGVTPDAEKEILVEALKPLADRIDLIIPGNHEDRLAKHGLDYTAEVAALIGRPQAYRPIPTVIRYSFNKRSGSDSFRANGELYIHHGYGGGRNEGGKLDKVKRLAEQKPDCHAYLMGHVHVHANTYDEIPLGWPIKVRRRLFAITGTYLESEAYAIKQNLPPGATGSPTVYLNYDHSRDDVVATLRTG